MSENTDQYRLSRRVTQTWPENDFPNDEVPRPVVPGHAFESDLGIGNEIHSVIIEIREEIIESVIEKLYGNVIDSTGVPLFVHCLKQAWRRLVNWSSYTPTPWKGAGWSPDGEPDGSPLEPCCFGIIPQKEKEEEKDISGADQLSYEHSSFASSTPTVVPEEFELELKKKKKKKVKKKKASALFEEEEEEYIQLEPRYAKSVLKSHKSTYTKSIASSIGWGEYKESKKKCVKLAKFISPKAFQKQLSKGLVRVHAPDGLNQSDEAKDYKLVVINVRDCSPENI